MNVSLFNTLNPLLAAEGQRQPGLGDMLIPLVLMFVMFYFILIRPQRQKQKAVQAQIAAMKKNDHVITIGGQHGIVWNVKEKTVVLKLVPDNVKVEFEKSAVGSVIRKEGGEEASKDEPSEKAGAAPSS